MNDLIKISKTTINGSEVNSVNSRDIYEYLEINSQYANWIQRAIEKYDFEENNDFNIFVKPTNNQKDYIVTMDMAKELCMVSNTEKGKEVRKYFIEVEKENNKPLTIEQLLQENVKVIGQLQDKVITLQNKVTEDKPKVLLANTLMSSENTLDVELFSKALYDETGIKLGRNKLFQWFREKGFLNAKNRPYQQFIDRGYFKLKEGTYINQTTQEPQIYFQLRITTKGQMYFTNRLTDEV